MLFVVRVVLHDGESLESALERFNTALQHDIGRPWHKHRYGYYEKPSRLRQKRRKMSEIKRGAEKLRQLAPGIPLSGRLKLHIGLFPLFERSGPNAAGR